MKILFINGVSKDQISGECRVAEEISHYFAKDPSLEVALMRSGEFTGEGKEEDGLKIFNVKGYNDSFVSISKFSSMDILKIRRFLKKFKPDVIHSHTLFPFTLVVQSWAINHKVPFLYTTHALPNELIDFVVQENTNFLKAASITLQSYAKVFYRNCDALIALNKPAFNGLREVGYKGPIYVIPNGRDLQKYYKEKEISFKDKEINLTFVGYLDARKNQDYLVKVLKFLPPKYHLHLIGTKDGKTYVQELEKLIKDLKLQKRVHLHGSLPHEEVISMLNNTHIFVSASTKEVQSLAILEALASGTPVVGLNNETVEDFINEHTGIKLEKNAKPQEFAKAVKRFSRLPDTQYKEKSLNCVKAVEHFDWSNVQEQTIEKYKEIISNRRSKRSDIQIMKLLKSFNNIFKEEEEKEEEKKQPKKTRKNVPFLFIFLAIVLPLYPIVYFSVKAINKRKQRRKNKNEV